MGSRPCGPNTVIQGPLFLLILRCAADCRPSQFSRLHTHPQGESGGADPELLPVVAQMLVVTLRGKSGDGARGDEDKKTI